MLIETSTYLVRVTGARGDREHAELPNLEGLVPPAAIDSKQVIKNVQHVRREYQVQHVVAVEHGSDCSDVVEGMHVTEQLISRTADCVDREQTHKAEAHEGDEAPQDVHLWVGQ